MLQNSNAFFAEFTASSTSFLLLLWTFAITFWVYGLRTSRVWLELDFISFPLIHQIWPGCISKIKNEGKEDNKETEEIKEVQEKQ